MAGLPVQDVYSDMEIRVQVAENVNWVLMVCDFIKSSTLNRLTDSWRDTARHRERVYIAPPKP